MPIYEYKCKKCNIKFDYLVRIAGEQVECPNCQHKDLIKLVSGFAFTSKDAGGNVTARSGSGCGTCHSSNCSTCGG